MVGIYDLTGGIYFKGDMLRKSIHYCRLPSNPSDDVSWRKIQIDKGRLVDIGVSVLEHDLIAILTYSDHPTIPRRSRIELSLIQLSTGRQHPLARNPVLVVSEGEMFQPAILLEIVGEFLVLIMTHHVGGPRPPDSIHVFEWKTGTLKMHITRPCFTYHDFIFLSPTIILLPNYHLNTLDAWELPTGTTPAPTEPFLSLALPGLSLGSFIINGSCRCEPNPAPSGIKHSNAAFSANPNNAIVVLNMRIHGPDGASAYSIYVHRGSLLQVCTTVRPEDEDGVSHFLPSTFTVERVPGKRVRAWTDWGPPICRAFDASTATLRWITTTAGQRAIVNLADNVEEGEHDPSLMLLDFNVYNVLRLVRAWCCDTGEFPDHEVDLQYTEITVSGLREPIRSRLPYISVKIPFPQDWRDRFEGLLLDEERILVLLV
ncbi:hypothetical protein H0H93_014727 [Arthromyces matolae]|nr:hypothetical protein H0H93_014727 [Arthromyces matolae]